MSWPAPRQTVQFFPTVYDRPDEAGVAILDVPDPGGLYVLTASASINVAATAGHGVATRLRLDSMTGPLLSGDGIRSGQYPVGELYTTVHPGMDSPVVTGPRRVIATVGRLTGSGRWEVLGHGNLLRVAVRPVARLLTVLGDSFASGHGGAGVGARGWPAMIAGRLGGDLVNYAVGGTGYVNNAGGHPFPLRAEIVPAESETVIVFGSLNDQTLPADAVGAAAADTYRKVRERAPGARLIVVGPQWPNAQRPADLLAVRAAVRSAAVAAGATFIDPLAEGWFDNRPDLIGPDGWHPNNAGHEHITNRITDRLS